MPRNVLLFRFSAFAILWFAAGAYAGDPYLVKDIKVNPESASYPGGYVEAAGKVFFAAETVEHGDGLWMADPSTGQTTLVMASDPAVPGSQSWPLQEHGGWLLFSARDEQHGRELWRTDGVTTERLTDINPGPGGSSPAIVHVDGSTLYLRADHKDYGQELWTFDGTDAELLGDIDPGFTIYGQPHGSSPTYFASVGLTHYFSVRIGDRSSLWRTTGTGGELVPVVDAGEEYWDPHTYLRVVIGDILYFGADGMKDGEPTGYELWKATAAGVELVYDFHPGSYTREYNGETYVEPYHGWPYYLTHKGNTLYIHGTGLDGTGNPVGDELWVVTEQGVELVDLFPGSTTWTHASTGEVVTKLNESKPGYFGEVNGRTLITASGTDPSGNLTGYELWELSGSTVTLVEDLYPGTYVQSYSGETIANSCSPYVFAEKNGKLYFSANTANEGRELWETDGTAAGTKLFADIWAGPDASLVSNFRILGEANGKTVFRARDAQGDEPWAVDWSVGTVTKLADINPGSGHSYGGQYGAMLYYGYELPGKVVFMAYAPGTGRELWVTDGTPGGTGPLVDVIPGPRDHPGWSSYNHNYGYPVVAADHLWFASDDLMVGQEPWWSDGTPAGTKILKDLEPTGGSDSYVSYFTPLGDIGLFVAHDGHYEGASGRELWRTDGTEAGTQLVKDINPDSRDMLGYRFYYFNTVLDGRFIFIAEHHQYGGEPWVSDGTEAGTQLLKDIRPGGYSSSPYYLATAHGYVYFRANDGVNGEELWRTDGTPEGTEMFDLRLGSTSSSGARVLAVMNDEIYLRALGHDASGEYVGEELFRATAAGVELVADLRPGTYSSSPYFCGVLDGKLLLMGYTDAGRVLWSFDPSDDSIEVLETLGDIWVQYLAATDTHVFLQGSGTVDGEPTGTELWATDGTAGGLALLADLAPGTYEYNGNTYAYSSSPQAITVHDGQLLFRANSTTWGEEPFISDGTPEGTRLLLDIYPGDYGSSPQLMTTYGGEVYFHARDPYHWYEIWKTDGTPENTKILKHLFTTNSYSYGTGFHAYGLLYFTGDDAEHGRELWRTDGTEEGTVLAAEIVAGPLSSYAAPLGMLGDLMILRADDRVHGHELWAMEPEPVFAVDFFPDGSQIDWVALKPMEFSIRASDFDGDPLTLTCSVNGQPIDDIGPGPTMTDPSGANPVTATFRWDPQVAEAGDYTIEFAVTDGTSVVTYTIQVALAGDTDGDGLPDYWETNGYTRFGEFVDLPNLTGMFQTNGADPDVPDIFVEIDYMENETVSHRPFNQAIQWVVQSFTNRGINLHVFVNDKVPFTEFLGPVPDDFYDWSEYDNYKDAYFTPAHRLAFRYCLFAHDLGNAIETGSGISRNVIDAGDLGASDFIVSLGGWTNGIGSQEEQAGTFMHELGHTLGRLHGGHEYQSQKPNYISIMNHDFQFGLLIEGLSAGEEWRRFDYSFVALPDIDERRPKESDGVIGNAGPLSVLDGYGTKWRWNGTLHETPPGVDVNDPLDWNGDGDTLDQGRMDLNDQSGYLTLAGSEDWSNLQYTGGLVGGGGIRLPKITEADEPTPEESREVFPEPPPNPNAPVAVATVPADRFLTDEAGTAEVPLSGVGSYDADGDAISWFWFEGTDLIATGETPTLRFAPGPHLVQLIVEDRSLSSEPVDVTFEVVVPVAQTVLVSPDPSSLWPPNSKLREVRLVVEQTDVTCEVTGVTADEEIDGPGAEEPDWELTDSPDVVKLRAERDGGGDGRVYTVTWRCEDAAGLTYAGSVEVTVPHDQGTPGAGDESGDDDGADDGEESSGEEPDGADAETDEDAGEDAGDAGGADDESAGAPQAVGGGDAPQVAGGGESDGGDAGGDESGNDDDESGEEEDESGAGGDADTPTAPDAPTLDGAGDVGSQAGDTNGGQAPAGAGNDGPQGGIEGGELNAGG